jgi:hypothetical protein
MVVHFVLSPAGTLVLQVSLKTMNNVSSTMRSRLCEICGFEVIYLDLNLSLLAKPINDEPHAK